MALANKSHQLLYFFVQIINLRRLFFGKSMFECSNFIFELSEFHFFTVVVLTFSKMHAMKVLLRVPE
jgi:hypothetical protein